MLSHSGGPLECHFCLGECGQGTEPYVAWELHEVYPDEWGVVCYPCVLVIEIGEGK